MVEKSNNSKSRERILIKIINLFVISIILVYLSGYFKTRYYDWLPTIPFVYPDNKAEAAKVAHLTSVSNIDVEKQYYINLFIKSDRRVSDAFKEIVPLSVATLDNIIMSPHVLFVILLLKYIINRARPIQIDATINQQKSISARTPAFPSGHCIQAYYLAKTLSREYPDHSQQLYKLAEDCAKARVYAGLHYPSDNEFGKWIALNIL